MGCIYATAYALVTRDLTNHREKLNNLSRFNYAEPLGKTSGRGFAYGKSLKAGLLGHEQTKIFFQNFFPKFPV